MHAYFDSPETIRNKVKEFKTATFNGLNKQDVMNYLSHLSEQQGVMIKLLREHNIPLFVDDGYNQEEDFMKPETDGVDLSQYISQQGADSEIIAELQAEIDVLKSENDELRLLTLNMNTEVSDFDAQLGFTNQGSEDSSLVDELRAELELKDMEIVELQSKLADTNTQTIDNDILANYQPDTTELENEIAELKAENEALRMANLNQSELVADVTCDEVDDDVLLSYEKEIVELKSQLQDTTLRLEEAQRSEDSVEALKSTIKTLEANVYDLQSELQEAHELLLDSGKTTDTDNAINNNVMMDTVSLDMDESEISSLRTNVEILELELAKKDKEKATLEVQLEEKIAELAKYTSYTDDNNEIVVVDPATLAMKHKELLSIQDDVLAQKSDIDSKLALLEEKEALIEANKHLVSEDYVNKITAKESEIDKLRKQMDKMLVVAEDTAETTIKDAEEEATNILDEANEKATKILEEAEEKKTALEEESANIIENAKEYKAKTEEELATFREETRKEAEDIILEARQTAEEVLNEANDEALKARETAMEEVELILKQAEDKVAEIEATIVGKQNEVDTIQKYYTKVKNDGLIGVKKLYNQLENIIYGDDSV